MDKSCNRIAFTCDHLLIVLVEIDEARPLLGRLELGQHRPPHLNIRIFRRLQHYCLPLAGQFELLVHGFATWHHGHPPPRRDRLHPPPKEIHLRLHVLGHQVQYELLPGGDRVEREQLLHVYVVDYLDGPFVEIDEEVEAELLRAGQRDQRGLLRLVPVILAYLYADEQVLGIEHPLLVLRLLAHVPGLLPVESGQVVAADVDQVLAQLVEKPGQLQRLGRHRQSPVTRLKRERRERLR